MVKKGFLKTTGCILISASIILTGWTFVGSTVSEAELDTNSEVVENTDNAGADSDNVTDLEEITVTPEDNSGNETDEVNKDTEDAVTPEEVQQTPVVDENTTEETADENTEKTTLDLNPASLLRSFSASLFSTPLLSSISSEPEYSGSTLVNVPAAYGDTITVKAGTTTIAANALSESNISRITFADAAAITSIGNQGDWPANGTKVYCPGYTAADCPTIVAYFTSLITSSRDIQIIFDEASTDAYSITITEVYGSKTEVIVYKQDDNRFLDYIYPTSHTGYVCNDSYTVTSEATQAHTFTYTEVDPSVTYTVTIKMTDEAGNSIHADIVEQHPAGYTVSAPTVAGYEVIAADKDLVYTVISSDLECVYRYKKTSDDPSATKYPVKVYEVLYDEGGTTIQSTRESSLSGSYAAAVVITANAVDGYTLFGSNTYTVTDQSSQAAIFTYKKNKSSNGGGSSSGGGSSGGSGSSSSSGSSSGSGATPASSGYATTAAQTTQAYVITQVIKQNTGAIQIVCNGPVEKFSYLLIDGSKVAASNYTIQSGSTIITLTKDYVSTLAIGDHAVQFQYTDGYAMTGLKVTDATAKTTTTVTYKVAADGSISNGHIKDTTPKTADGFDSRYLLCLAIFLLGAGALMMGNQRKLETILASIREE